MLAEELSELQESTKAYTIDGTRFGAVVLLCYDRLLAGLDLQTLAPSFDNFGKRDAPQKLIST